MLNNCGKFILKFGEEKSFVNVVMYRVEFEYWIDSLKIHNACQQPESDFGQAKFSQHDLYQTRIPSLSLHFQ